MNEGEEYQKKTEWPEWINTKLTIGDFVETIRRLPVKRGDIKGDVLIAGHGSSIPERALVCSQKSGWSKMREGVRSLTCCDCEILTNPELLFEQEVLAGPFPRRRGEISEGTIRYSRDSFQYALDGVDDDTFDTALFFRIQMLQEQLEQGLLQQIGRVLKPHGIFTESGSFDSMEAAEGLTSGKFEIKSIKELPNPDYSGYPYKTHVGFVLEKRDVQ
jgi:hypothetical protein